MIAQEQAIIPLVSNVLALAVHVLLGFMFKNYWNLDFEFVGICTTVHFLTRWVFALTLIIYKTDFLPYLMQSWRVWYMHAIMSQLKFCAKNMFVTMLPLWGSECFVIIASQINENALAATTLLRNIVILS